MFGLSTQPHFFGLSLCGRFNKASLSSSSSALCFSFLLWVFFGASLPGGMWSAGTLRTNLAATPNYSLKRTAADGLR